MQLKVQGIANDPIKKVAVMTLVDVLDDLPHISATVMLVTSASQTQTEIHAALKHQMRLLFEEAILGLDRFAVS